MGVVYSAQHLKLNRLVALKMLRSGAYASPAEMGRFSLEAQAIAGLRHPHIVEMYDLGEVEGRPNPLRLADCIAAGIVVVDLCQAGASARLHCFYLSGGYFGAASTRAD